MVSRAFAQVLARKVALTAIALAGIGPSVPCRSRNSTSDTAVLARPMSPKLTRRRPKSSASGRRATGPKSILPAPCRERAEHAGRALEVAPGGARDVHAAVGVVDPVDRHLVDAQAVALGEQQQLGVEEPAVVDHRGHQPAGDIGTHRLEPALRVAHPGGHDRAQDQVVGARDEFALRRAGDGRRRREAATDRHVGVARHQRRDERQQRVEIGGEVDVHVGDDGRVVGAPRRAQRAAATLAVEVQGAHAGRARRRGSRRCARCRRWRRCRRR